MTVHVLETAPRAEPAPAEVSLPEADRLVELAHQLAHDHAVVRAGGLTTPLLDRLTEHEDLLEEAHTQFASAWDEALSFSYAAEWLLDNFYIVRQTLHQIHEDMPRRYYRQLPKLSSGPLSGYPRVYAIARVLTHEANALLDSGQLRRFVHAYQTVTPLTMGELWAVPIMLLFNLVEYLATAIARLTELPLAEASASLAPEIKEGNEDAIVANSIVSLRAMATEDWKNFFEELSLVEQVLRNDPAQVYPQMDFETRDRYRKVVEELAKQIGDSEITVAQTAIDLAHKVDRENREGNPARRRHVGYYLIDTGRTTLEARLAYHPAARVRLRRWLFKHATVTYLGSVALFTGLILWLIGQQVLAAGGSAAHLLVVGSLALVPASGAAVTVVNWIITHLT
ncbi:MAG TPA: hypothetical protein VLG46_07145, partial [Anaerolineae bacterium]|nr:hypothetical protein [Anaerolineae bacterium]